MKILLVVADLIVGGITTSAFNFSNEMIKRGHEVTFLDLSNTVEEKDLPNPQIKIARLEGRSKYWNITAKNSNGLSPILHKFLGLVKKITVRIGIWYKMIFTKFCPQEEFDVAIAFRQCEPCYAFVLDCVRAKKKMGFVHGDIKNLGDISSWQKYMYQFDKIAYVSKAVKDGFEEKYPDLKKNSCVIYNMFDDKRILDLSEKQNVFSFRKDTFNIITVARITKQKQIDWIVTACKKIKEICSNSFHWFVVGDGYFMDEVRQMAIDLSVTDVLTFTGELENPYSLMKDADITVLTSKEESFGMVVVESFILKKPIVISEYKALKEIMSDDKYGIVVPQNVELLTEAVIKMIKDENSVFTNSKNNLLSYKYSNDYICEQFFNAVE